MANIRAKLGLFGASMRSCIMSLLQDLCLAWSFKLNVFDTDLISVLPSLHLHVSLYLYIFHTGFMKGDKDM